MGGWDIPQYKCWASMQLYFIMCELFKMKREIMIYKYHILILQLIMAENFNPQYKIMKMKNCYVYKMCNSHHELDICII